MSTECAADSNSELDWSYTARCTKEWSDDELLNHLCSNAFTIPPRDYNPSAPFVYIRTEDGVVTTLPHGYRLPLMFIAKYQWEITARTLSLQNRQRWEAVRSEILHLSRLCQTLFLKAHAKSESSGMEKGWRCIMFDRVLTRVYKGWPVSSPAKVDAFLSHFSSKEYERDVLKYDWKRWVSKGFFRPTSSSAIYLTEEDVSEGISAVDLKRRLSKIDNVWTLSTRTKSNYNKRRPIKFMQAIDGSSSELTDLDSSIDGDEDEELAEITRNTNLNLHPPLVIETLTKRGREASQDDDIKNRLGKRAKLEEIVRSISSLPCTPITSAGGLHHGDLCQEEHDPLPKFKVPRQILHSCGWKPLPATTRPRQREERRMEEELQEGIVPPCGVDNSSALISTPPPHPTSTITLAPPIPPDHNSPSSHPNPSTVGPNNDSTETILNTPSLMEHTSATSLSAPIASSISKIKQPASLSASIATTTLRNPRNSAYVSLPSSSRMKPRRKLASPAPAPASPEPPSLSRVAEKGGATLKVKRRYIDKQRKKADVVKTKDKEKEKEICVEERKPNMPHSGPSLSSPSVTNAVSNEHPTTATAVTIPDSPLNQALDLVHTRPVEFQLLTSMLDPKRLIMDNDRISLSSPLSSLSPSLTPGPSMGDTEVGPEQMKDRIRELKTRFMGFRDELGGVIARLEELGPDGDGDRGVCLRDEPNFVSQEERRRRKGKNREKDVEMLDAFESGAVGYVDAAVGINASVVFRDVSVQTDEPVNTAAVQTVNVNPATSLPETLDDLSNLTKKNLGQIKPTLSLESKTDDGFPAQTPLINNAAASSSQLSTMVDNLVSIKMLSMMQTLVKSSIGGSSSNGKAKLVEPSSTANANAATNSTTTITTESDSDTLRQTSPSSSLSISAVDTYDNIMSSLLDELKTIKEEARFREQSEKEDLLAMRQLHSAEVDALRRRLSYLEWRNMSGSSGSGGGEGRWRGSRVDDTLDLDRRHHHPDQYFEDNQTPFRQSYGDDRFQPNGHSSSIVNYPEGGGELTRTNTTTTPTTSQPSLSLRKPNPGSTIERYHGVSKNPHQRRQHMDWNDDIVNLSLPLPLPVKSQRKQHMMPFARAHFS